MTITIFTPAYNRAEFLRLIYDCLSNQTSYDFEWIVVDDGSIDDTCQVMESIMDHHRNSFPIKFFHKENGGKHSAINKGLQEAEGELFLILDSDDSLPVTAVIDIINQYKTVADDPMIGGVCGLMAHHDGVLIGSGYPDGCDMANSIEIRYKYGVTGDLAEVFKTSVLREFPFPEIAGEKFCPEALVWNRIAHKYRLKCFNKVIYFRDYIEGGLTDNIVKIRMKSPISSMMCYSEINKLSIPLVYRMKAAINYWRFRFCRHKVKEPRIDPIWSVFIPLAFVMHLHDLKLNNR